MAFEIQFHDDKMTALKSRQKQMVFPISRARRGDKPRLTATKETFLPETILCSPGNNVRLGDKATIFSFSLRACRRLYVFRGFCGQFAWQQLRELQQEGFQRGRA